jgi:hypothetical protein
MPLVESCRGVVNFVGSACVDPAGEPRVCVGLPGWILRRDRAGTVPTDLPGAWK